MSCTGSEGFERKVTQGSDKVVRSTFNLLLTLCEWNFPACYGCCEQISSVSALRQTSKNCCNRSRSTLLALSILYTRVAAKRNDVHALHPNLNHARFYPSSRTSPSSFLLSPSQQQGPFRRSLPAYANKQSLPKYEAFILSQSRNAPKLNRRGSTQLSKLTLPKSERDLRRALFQARLTVAQPNGPSNGPLGG